MDYQEAIDVLSNEIGCVELDSNNRGHIYESEQKFMDACNTAISAMQEMQEYRKLGTLVEVREAMQELKLYKDAKLCLIPEDVFSKQCEEADAYREIGTLEEVREAVEKQRAKKPNNVGAEGYRYTDTYRCPTCGGNFSGTGIANYCYHCGQKIDWEEVK